MLRISQLNPDDRWWVAGLLLMAIASGCILLWIVIFLLWETLPFLKSVGFLRLLQDLSWSPTLGEFNLFPMVMGSVAVTLGALLFAIPLGVGSAIFCQFYAPHNMAVLFRRALELLAGIPSVVYGFWGLVVIVPQIAKLHPPGPSLLAGSLIVGLMILPTIALISESALVQLPADYWRSAQGMGLGTWATISRVCLPAAQSGLITAIILAFGRAIGETMAVVMVCGNAIQVPDSAFDSVRTLTANIALEMAYAMDLHRSALFVSGLILVSVVALTMSLLPQHSLIRRLRGQ